MSNNLFLFSFSVIENWSMNSGKAFGILKTEIEDDSSDINYIRSKFCMTIFVINQICSNFENYTTAQ